MKPKEKCEHKWIRRTWKNIIIEQCKDCDQVRNKNFMKGYYLSYQKGKERKLKEKYNEGYQAGIDRAIEHIIENECNCGKWIEIGQELETLKKAKEKL